MSSITATTSALTPTIAAATRFQRIDTDGDGALSQDEFSALDAAGAERRQDRFEGGGHAHGPNGPGRPERDYAQAVQSAQDATAGGEVDPATGTTAPSNAELQQTVAALSEQVSALVAQLQALTGTAQLASTGTNSSVSDAQAGITGIDIDAALAAADTSNAAMTSDAASATTAATGAEVASDPTLSQLPAAQQETLQAAVDAGLQVGTDGAGNYLAQDAITGATYAIAADGAASQVDVSSTTAAADTAQ